MTKLGHVVTGFGSSVLFGFDPLLGTFGAIFPDYDIFIAKLFGTWKTNKKKRLLTAHRGFTHHFTLIPFFLFLAFLLKEKGAGYFLASSFLFGYAVHLLGDILTPLGLPYRFSYYPRISYSLFKTGSLKETLFIYLFSIGVGGYILYTDTLKNTVEYLLLYPLMVLREVANALNISFL